MTYTARFTTLVLAALLAGTALAGCSATTAAPSPAPTTSATGVPSDADVAFAQLMIPHHEQAIEMSELALQRGESTEVRRLAEQILAAQGPEIDMMRGWLASWGAPESMAEDGGHGDMDMGGMHESGMMTDAQMADLARAEGMAFDRLWLEMMIAHHEGAVQMAEQVGAVTARPEVAALASAIVTGQNAEIDAMRTLVAGPPATTASSDVPAISGREVPGHIHNLSLRDGTLVLGTHEGLWIQRSGEDPARASREAFDVMGFAMGDGAWFASGHPGPGMDAPAHLGLVESVDQGQTWSPVSLSGEVDFHRLVVAGGRLLGLNSLDGTLLRSTDSGRTWSDLGRPPLFDLAVSPQDTATIVGTTADGPVRSLDGGETFASLPGAPLLALLSWTPVELVGVDLDGRLFSSTDSGTTWTARGSAGGPPSALAADASGVVVLVGDTVLESVDGGVTFRPRLNELAGH